MARRRARLPHRVRAHLGRPKTTITHGPPSPRALALVPAQLVVVGVCGCLCEMPARRSTSSTSSARPGGFAPPSDVASYKDLLLFEERLKQNAALLRSRKRKYEGERDLARRDRLPLNGETAEVMGSFAVHVEPRG